MIRLVTQHSSSREIGFFIALTFAISWLPWLAGIKAGAREELLFVGVAGPALAAALLRGRGSGPSQRRFPLALFIVMIPVCWAALVLSIASRVSFREFDWNALLLLPAALPAFVAAFLYRNGDTKIERWRWPLIAVFSMPAYLVVPALIARMAGLPILYPRRDAGVTLSLPVAGVLFIKHLLYAGLLEEPGWRGWLLPRLQQRQSPLVASVLVWFPWALWHAPLDFTGSVGRTWLNYIQVRVIFFVAISILLTWLYNRSAGSILVVALFHAGFNTFPFLLPYSPPFLALIFIWAAWAVFADRMWQRPKKAENARAASS